MTLPQALCPPATGRTRTDEDSLPSLGQPLAIPFSSQRRRFAMGMQRQQDDHRADLVDEPMDQWATRSLPSGGERSDWRPIEVAKGP